MMHFSMLNVTVHPTSVSTRIPKREVIDNSGTMCPTRVVRRPGIMMSHMCVDITLRSSANATFSGHVIFHLLWMGMPSMTKIWVAPESAIASFDVIVIVAYAHVYAFCGVNKENADSILFVDPSDTFDVTTVMSSSSTSMLWVAGNIWVGSDAMLITENVSLHLNAMSLLIAPNHHICGKAVLWRFLVAQLYPWLMNCCAFCLVKWMSWSGFRKL